jgi:autotransporter-associated beta strand protein
MDANWVWQARDSSTAINIMALHDTDGTVNSNVVFEFDNTSAHSTNTSKIGASDTRVENDDYVATVTYHDGSTALDLSNSGIGSTIVSGFDSTARIYGANDANILTINSASGNDGTEAFLHSGDIYNASSGTNASDLTIIKSGDGTQVLTGNINLADSTSSGESAYISIEGGTLEFDAASGKTQVIEYLKGSTGTLILDNTGRADQTLELGFAQSHSLADATFSGAVTLQGSNTKNTIKVSTGTAANDYTNEQVLSGVISGGEVLVKDGVGILTLEGNNANTGGVEINNGTLKVGNSGNDADLGSGTVTINKGKLEVLAGDTIANQIVGISSDDTKKSMLGGDGTFSYTTGDGIVVGSGNTEIDVISPGQGVSSSFTETSGLSNQQVTIGTSSAASAIGELTITELTVNDGAIFDWEINDFSSSAGTGWDVLRFGSLKFDSDASASGLINIFSVANDGTAGAVSNMSVPSNGLLFLDSIDDDHNDIDWGGISGVSSGSWQQVDWMAINDASYSFHNDSYGSQWNVWYNGSGDFYLRYSAVPEPSTYIMITGLLMLPGFRMFRKFFKKAKPENCSTDS